MTLHYNYGYNCNYHYTTLKLLLQLHYTTLHPAVVVRWPLQPWQALQKTQVQPPFSSLVDSLCHPCTATTHLSYSVLSLKLPPQPCAVQQNHHVLLTFDNVQNPLCLPRKTTSERPEVLRTRQFFTLLTLQCASRHNGVHFFDTSTSKSGPDLVCFVHFDLETRFAPQRHALFWHLNFQKWSKHEVFCAVWHWNVLRATTACNFSSLIWPDGSAPAALASLPSDTYHWKNTVKCDVSTFSRACIFFLLTLLFSDLLSSPLLLWLFPPLLFHLSIVGSLTSKLPSITSCPSVAKPFLLGIIGLAQHHQHLWVALP